jgi:hypothetical protein
MPVTAQRSTTTDIDRLLRSLGAVRQQVRLERLAERLACGPVAVAAVRHRLLRRATELDLLGGPTVALWLYHPLGERPIQLRSIRWHDAVGWAVGVTTAARGRGVLLAWQLRIGQTDRATDRA